MEYICDLGISYDMIVRRSHVREEIVRCRNCEMCKEQEIYDENGNVEDVEFKCARPIMFLEKGGMSTRSMQFESYLGGMSVILQNVNPNGFCAWGKKKV